MSTEAALTLTIVLPLPPAELSPNGRPHWRAKAAKTATYRQCAKEAAMIAAYENSEVSQTMPWRSATTQATFYHKDSRRRDRDNLLASIKAGFDGLRDAGLLIDDDELTHLPVVREVDRSNPRVEIELTYSEE